MLDFIAERKLLIFSILIIIGFFALAVYQSPTDNSTAANDYKSIDTSSPMYKGSTEASVSVIQYSDFLCPSCSLFSIQVMPTIEDSYIDTNKVNFEFRPMAFIADGSYQAGMGGYCAIDQEMFWPYHDAIYNFVANEVFVNNKDPKSDIILTANLVKTIAEQAGLEKNSFGDCMDSKEHLVDINKSTNDANSNGVNSTPYILVNGSVYSGGATLAPFEALIKASL